MDETLWLRLIAKIREHNVVPIIGPRLLVSANGQTSLQAQIAARLLRQYGKDIGLEPLPPFRELNEAVSRLKGNGPVKQEFYDSVNAAICTITTASDFAIPQPIRQLAEIADFRLFVTLTPDDLLARSLRRRCAVNEIVHSPNLPNSEKKDLPSDWQERSGEVYLLYLFGKSRSAQMFAIHDEDVLEYAHNVMVHDNYVPSAFLDELQRRDLLLVGCNFPDWLSRFFMRATNQKRLSEAYRTAWLIEQLRPEESFTCFLKSFSSDTEILSENSPVEFVAELHRRWMADHGGSSQATPAVDEAVKSGAMFFISYSRKTDLPRAESLYQALLRQRVTKSEIWFDRQTIEPGQDFQRRILDGIGGCRYFLPLLSQAANMRDEAFVFREWRAANYRRGGMNREFIFPVIVDAEYEPERYTNECVREWIKRLDFGHAPEGVPNGQLEAKLKKLVREARAHQRSEQS